MARGKARYSVTVLDLIRAGILNPGAEATFEPRKGEVYTGRVEANGDLILDGRQFHAPSDAATTLAGNSRNGWKEVKVNGRPLAEYRKQLGGPKLQAVQPPPPRAEPPVRTSLLELIRVHLEEVKSRLAQRIADLSADQFEHFVAELLTRQGYSDVRRVGGPGDRNVDIAAAYRAPSIRFPIRVQVKHRRSGPNIGPTDVAAFRDRAGGPGHTLLMVTNVEFTDGAKETASEEGRQVVHLTDGKELINLMVDKRIGLKEGPMGVPDIDEDFWSQF
jgi:hypothetical protein